MTENVSYVIYSHTNLTNQKSYIGWTVCHKNNSAIDSMIKRWNKHVRDARRGSRLIFHKAICKYGTSAWNHTILEELNDLQSAKLAEKRWIMHENTCILNNGHGYNMTFGGDGGQTYEFDAARKTRIHTATRGENNPRSKLTYADVQTIRDLYANGCIKQRELAKQFDVSQVTISDIVRNKSWISETYVPPEKCTVLIKASKAHNNKSVAQINLNGVVVAIHVSLLAAANSFASSHTGNISSCCLGKRRTAFKHHWLFVAEQTVNVGDKLILVER